MPRDKDDDVMWCRVMCDGVWCVVCGIVMPGVVCGVMCVVSGIVVCGIIG